MTKKKNKKSKSLNIVTATSLLASTMSLSTVTVDASTTFTDIEKSYHKQDILTLLNKGIISGYGDGTFKPEAHVTRGEASKMIAKMLNLHEEKSSTKSFTDVPASHPYSGYIHALVNRGVISGYSDNTFRAGQHITRGEMAKMLSIAYDLKSESNSEFSDIPKNAYYAPHVSALVAYQITNGTSSSTYSPLDKVSRGQMASFLARADQNVKSNGLITGTIESIENNTITINGESYSITNFQTLLLGENKTALIGAEISATQTGKKLTKINSLTLANAETTFNGQGITIDTLTVKSKIGSIKNVQASTINISSNSINFEFVNVHADQVKFEKLATQTASLQLVQLQKEANKVNFVNSNISTITIDANKFEITKTNSILNKVDASKVNHLTINGDFKNVLINPATMLNGTAKVENLLFDTLPNNFSIISSINVSKVEVNGKTYNWSDAVNTFNINTTTPDEEVPSQEENTSTPGGSNNGNSSDNGTDDSSPSPEDNNKEENNTPPTEGNENGDHNENETSTPEGNGNENENETLPNTNLNLEVNEETNEVTIGENQYILNDKQIHFIAQQQEHIQAINIAVNENNEPIIESITIVTDHFDGTSLQNVYIEELRIESTKVENINNVDNLVVTNENATTLSNVTANTIEAKGNIASITNTKAKSITLQTTAQSIALDRIEGDVSVSGNVSQIIGDVEGTIALDSSAEQILISSNADSLNLMDTRGNVRVTGAIQYIEGGDGGNLIISSSIEAVTVGDIGVDEVVINNTPSPVALAFSTFAALRQVLASTATMTVKFAGDSYKDTTLKVERTDTIIDVQSENPFSKVAITGNRNVLNSSSQLAQVVVGGMNTYLTLNAQIADLAVHLIGPTTIASTEESEIDLITITTDTNVNSDGWLSLINIRPTNMSINSNEIHPFDSNNPIFYKNTVSNEYFESTITAYNNLKISDFGKYKITVPKEVSNRLYVVQLTEGQNISEYLERNTLPDGAIQYTDGYVFIDADTENIVIYEMKEDNVTISKVSKVNTSGLAKNSISVNQETGNLTFYTRYNPNKPLKDQIGYLYLYKDGKLVYERTDFSDVTFNTANNSRSFIIKTDLKSVLKNSGEAYFIKGEATFKNQGTVEPYYSQMLTSLATKAKNNPEIILQLLTKISGSNNKTFDSTFLKDYVDAINLETSKYENNLTELLNLVEKLTPKYQLDIKLSAEDLYLPETPTLNNISYSNPDIVKAELATSEGKLLLQPLAVGKTTIRVLDEQGNASLLNVSVIEQNNELVIESNYEVVKMDQNTLPFFAGDTNFRFYKGSLLPTTLTNSVAILKNGTTKIAYESNQVDNQYKIQAIDATHIKSVTNADLNLGNMPLELSEVDSSNFATALTKNSSDLQELIVVGKKQGSGVIRVSDGTKSVLVNVTVSDTETSISSPISLTLTDLPVDETAQLVHPEDASIVRIEGNKVYALNEGEVEVLVGNKIQRLKVTKVENNGKVESYSIVNKATISDVVYSSADLGLGSNVRMQMNLDYDADNFYAAILDRKLIAYSVSTSGVANSTDLVVYTSSKKTLIQLKDDGNNNTTGKIARLDNVFKDKTFTLNNNDLTREADGHLYMFDTGHTFAAIDGLLHTIQISRVGGLLNADVKPLAKTGDYEYLPETNKEIINITTDADGTTLSGLNFGSTTVKRGNSVIKVTIENNNGQLNIKEDVISSKILTALDADLTNIKEATVLYGDKNAVLVTILDKDADENSVALYSSTKTPQSLVVQITDKNDDKALIQVTINNLGEITTTDYIFDTFTNLPNNPGEDIITDNVRALWYGTELKVYPTSIGNSGMKFATGLVNATTSKDDANKITFTATPLTHTFTAVVNQITNGSMLQVTDKTFNVMDEGTALVHSGGKVYTITVSKQSTLYDFKVSNGVPFKEISLAENNQYVPSSSSLHGVSVALDDILDGTDTNEKLIIYTDESAPGMSEIVISNNNVHSVYQVLNKDNVLSSPKLAEINLDSIPGAISYVTGDSIRISSDKLYYLKEGLSSVIFKNRLATMNVTRDANGYFTHDDPIEYVSNSLSLAPEVELDHYEFEGKTIYAKNSAITKSESVLIIDDSDEDNEKVLYSTYSTVFKNNQYEIQVDERKAKYYAPDDLKLTTNIKSINNTSPNVASMKVVDGKVVFIAGQEVGSTTITLEDKDNNKIDVNISYDIDGNFNVIPQAPQLSLKFVDLDLTTDKPITAIGNDEQIVKVNTSANGFNFEAYKIGTTSFEVKQDNKTKALVNVTVEEVNKNLNVSYKVLEFETDRSALIDGNFARKHSTTTSKYYATKEGKALYAITSENKADFVTVTKNPISQQYQLTKSTYNFDSLTKAQLGLPSIDSAVPDNSVVETLISENKDTLYVVGLSTNTTNIIASDGDVSSLVVSINTSEELKLHVASEDLPDSPSIKWNSSAPTVAIARNGKIFAQEVGVASLTGNTADGDILMNVTVTENENRTLKIKPELVELTTIDTTKTTIISGEQFITITDDRLFAKKAGTAIISVEEDGQNITYEVVVTENPNGTHSIKLGEQIASLEYSADDFDLTELTKFKINAINGSGIVTAILQEEVDPKDNKLTIFAKNTGQAELLINDGEAIVHLDITLSNSRYSIKPTIASNEITDGSNWGTKFGDGTIVRFADSYVYAKKVGKFVATNPDDELYNVTVSKNNHNYEVDYQRIEYTFTETPTLTKADGSILKVDGKTIIALDEGQEEVLVNGKKYLVTITDSGSINVQLFDSNSFKFADTDIAAKFNALTLDNITSVNGLTTITLEDQTINFDPKSTAGTDLVTVEQGNNTALLRVTVEGNSTEGFAVTKVELMSQTMNANDLNGLYGFQVTSADGTTIAPDKTLLELENGLVMVSNGLLIVYPGATGKSHFIVKNQEGKQGLYELDTNTTTQTFTVTPIKQEIENNKYGYAPTVIYTEGNNLAKNIDTGLEINFADTDKTIFVTHSGENLYHTTVTKANLDVDNNQFTLDNAIVNKAVVINGEIHNVTGNLKSITHNGKSILYVADNTEAVAQFTDAEGILYKVTIHSTYKLDVENYIASTDEAYKNLQFISGTDVVGNVEDKLVVKQIGEGIYKTAANQYVKIKIDSDASDGYTPTFESLLSKDISSLGSDLKVLIPSENVLIHQGILIGNTTEKVVISATENNQTYLYATTQNSNFNTLEKIKVDLTKSDLLGWNTFESSTLPDGSQIGSISGNYFFPKTNQINDKVITFTSESGVKKQVTFTMSEDYTLSAVPSKDIVSYSFADDSSDMVFFTFDVNVDNLADGEFLILNDNDNDSPISEHNQIAFNLSYETAIDTDLKINIPERKTDKYAAFTISLKLEGNQWIVESIGGDTIQFNAIN